MLAPDHLQVPYGSDPDQWLDVYLPPGLAPGSKAPAIVFFHGGGGGAPAVPGAGTDPGLLDPTTFGWAFVFVEYRRFPTHIYPVPNDDPRLALSFLASSGTALGIDGTRLVPMGRSFGAYLVALALVHPSYRIAQPVKGAALLQGMLDWTQLVPSYAIGHFGTTTVGQVPAATLLDASPLPRLKALPASTLVPSAFSWYGGPSAAVPPYTNPHQPAYGKAWTDELRRRGAVEPTHIEGPWSGETLERWIASIGA